MPRTGSVDHAAAIALLVEGHTCLSASRALGCRRSSVEWIARRYRNNHPAALPKPRTTWKMPRYVRVPDEYRAAGLAEDYRDLVRDFGDAEGERRCRRLLDETRRLEALDARMGSAA